MVWLLNAIAFLAAFLLFQIELIVAKLLLPNYGGSYMVWGSCVVFFQVALLLGYVFTHFAIRKFGMHRHRLHHLLILALAPLAFFPGRPLNYVLQESQLPLAADVFLKLFATIGPVFFALSTIGVVLQCWLSESNLPQRKNPYFLYSISNLGSFAALLSYPLLIEAHLDLSQQIYAWRLLYFALIGLSIASYLAIKVNKAESQKDVSCTKHEKSKIARWFLLGAAPVILFLSITNIITSEVAPLPLLWVIPLCIYLLAFVLNFKRVPICPKWIVEKIHVIIGMSVLLYFIVLQRNISLMIELILLNSALFILCMYCKNQLISHKPRKAEDLTFFYIIISFGGAVGGFITSWVFPLIATNMVEYLFGLYCVAMTFALNDNRIYLKKMSVRLIGYLIGILMIWPVVFPEYHFWGLLLVISMFILMFSGLKKDSQAIAAALICILCLSSTIEEFWIEDTSFYKKRNYYGIYRVADVNGARRLVHGTTLHGLQYLDEPRKPIPTTYYGPNSPVWDIMADRTFQFDRIGSIGLGAGTLATYLWPDQTMDIYELDPDVYPIAQDLFTYISRSAGAINYVFGDARISMEKNPDLKYKLIIVDAFGGDSVPVHLLTEEAIAMYREHLDENGLILFHISNRYLRLGPPLSKVALTANARAFYKFGKASKHFDSGSSWMGMTWDEQLYKKIIGNYDWKAADPKMAEQVRLWTDQYSNILPFLKTDSIIAGFKHFKPFYW